MLAGVLALLLTVEAAFYVALGVGMHWSTGRTVAAAFSIGIGWRGGLVVALFAIARIASREKGSGPVRLLRMVVVETFVVAFGYGVAQIFDRWITPRPSRNDGPLVVLVHGYACNGASWAWFRNRLRNHGYDARSVTLEPPIGSIDGLADQLAAHVERMAAERRVILVGHSMGGLVGRAYVQRYGAARVSHLITLGTPHRGTVHAWFGLGRAAREMAPGSDWLQALWASRGALATIPGGVVTLYSIDDNFVAPAESAALPDARVVRVSGHSHIAMLFSPRILRTVLDLLPPPDQR